MKYKKLITLISLLIMLLCISHNTEAADKSGSVIAASDGAGNIRIMWYASPKAWPAGGWQLEDDKGHVIFKQILPGDPVEMKRLSEQDQKGIKKLADINKITDKEKRQQRLTLTVMRAITDWDYAKAAGLGRELSSLSPGPRKYRVLGLDGKGNPANIRLETGVIDPAVATPLPSSPQKLMLNMREESVELFWQPPVGKLAIPVYTYAVERSSNAQAAVSLIERGQFYEKSWDAKTPVFTDRSAPVEQEVTYQAFAIDVLGRRSSPVTASLFVTDYDALRPPARVKASGDQGRVKLTWETSSNSHIGGFFIARAFLHQGPYEVLNPEPLKPGATDYIDEQVQGGTNYFYRIYAMNTHGKLGPPSEPAAAQPQAEKPPIAPGKLQADIGRTRIRLTWEPVPAAGYIIERRVAGNKEWSRLNEQLVAEPRFDDYAGSSNGGELEYRIFAIGQDNQSSAPGKTLVVRLQDTVSPLPPRITGASGENGQVVLNFLLAPPEDDTKQVLILRGSSAEEPGLVIGDPLNARSRSFEDRWVEPGQTYWYRLVAVDATGNRSDPGEAVAVLAASPAIPQPGRLKAEYVAKPFRHVRLTFGAPPDGLAVIVQSSVDNLHWRHVSGPANTDNVADTDPPASGTVNYRIIYQATNGMMGMPSKVEAITMP